MNRFAVQKSTRAPWQVVDRYAPNAVEAEIELQLFTTRADARCYCKHRNAHKDRKEAQSHYINDI